MEHVNQSAKQANAEMHFPFKDHTQFPILIDILSRKDHHHLCLGAYFSAQMYPFLLQALRHYLASDAIPSSLRAAEITYIHQANELNEPTLASLKATQRCFILALPASLLKNNHIALQVEMYSSLPQCRIILLANHSSEAKALANCYTLLEIKNPSKSETLAIFRHQCTQLENFHNVLIPDELLELAYLLAERYLSADNTFENALALLDSSAARASIKEDTLNKATLINVLSSWTQIPSSHLTLNTFNLQNFMSGMQQQVFGQDAAIHILNQKLQQPHTYWEQPKSPFFTFLFAGPEHSGKKTAAHALTEQLFKQLNVLYYTQATYSRIESIADIKLQRSLEHHYTPLKEVIQQTPYAVIMFENIDRASPVILDGLFEIFSTGYLHDHDGRLYNFRQAIIILSTTLGTKRLSEIAKTEAEPDNTEHLDWMQLVMLDSKRDNKKIAHHYSSQDMVQEIIPEITTRLPAALCQHLCIVPFLPLTQPTIEKIIRLKLKELGNEMHARYGMELGYAPEVLRFLAKEVFTKQETDHHAADIKKALQPLYFSVEQAIASQVNNETRPNQLFLQLNETGQFLRCDYVDLGMTTQMG